MERPLTGLCEALPRWELGILLGSAENEFWAAGSLHRLGAPSHWPLAECSYPIALQRFWVTFGSPQPTEWVLSLACQAHFLTPGDSDTRCSLEDPGSDGEHLKCILSTQAEHKETQASVPVGSDLGLNTGVTLSEVEEMVQ